MISVMPVNTQMLMKVMAGLSTMMKPNSREMAALMAFR